jgi:ACS family hexuronate transporter-like MFS transporter
MGAGASLARWYGAILVGCAIALSYLDRQTLPWALKNIQADIPITNQVKAALDSTFLVTYGLAYFGGGWLLDRLGTKRGFLVIMLFWSAADASHGLAGGVLGLATSRLLLGAGEGGGFPAATRAIAEWFRPQDRAAAMGIVNAGTAVGAVIAPPLIALVLLHVHGFDLASWRWVFLLTGLLGVLWSLWWAVSAPPLAAAIPAAAHTDRLKPTPLPRPLLWIAFAKFLTDAAWYFYLFWLPKYLFDARGFDLQHAASIGWIPYAMSGVGCLVGGAFSSHLLRSGHTLNVARKAALGASAALMPWVMLVPAVPSIWQVLALFSLAFFGQQSWSTLIMTLPADLAPLSVLGRAAGLVGLAGAAGGVVMGQVAGWLLDHGFTYTPVLLIAGSLHVIAFAVICIAVPRLQPATKLESSS